MENNKYNDIINLSRPISITHKKMSIADRAAQFAPFAALTGFEDEIEETGRITYDEIELDQDKLVELDIKLRKILESSDEKEVMLTYFVPDISKAGGSYKEIKAHIRGVDEITRELILENKDRIALDLIVDIKI